MVYIITEEQYQHIIKELVNKDLVLVGDKTKEIEKDIGIEYTKVNNPKDMKDDKDTVVTTDKYADQTMNYSYGRRIGLREGVFFTEQDGELRTIDGQLIIPFKELPDKINPSYALLIPKVNEIVQMVEGDEQAQNSILAYLEQNWQIISEEDNVQQQQQ